MSGCLSEFLWKITLTILMMHVCLDHIAFRSSMTSKIEGSSRDLKFRGNHPVLGPINSRIGI